MKKTYEAPMLEIEVYELHQSIAANCDPVISNGPANEITGEEACADYPSIWSNRSTEIHPTFWDTENSGCDCYTTAANSNYWTS